MNYEIRFYSDYEPRYVVIASCTSLAEACKLRSVSGDLVVDPATNKVVDDPQWLWDWEQANPNSYAMQNLGRHRPGKRVQK